MFALVVVIAAAPFAFPAVAQQGAPDSAMRWFDGIDVNQDDFMTAEEMAGVRDKRCDRTDGNGDGAVTVDEYVFGMSERDADAVERRRKRHAVIDRDGDGSVTKKEYMAFGDRVMEIADLDGDGRVSRAEFAQSVAPSQ